MACVDVKKTPTKRFREVKSVENIDSIASFNKMLFHHFKMEVVCK